MEKSNYEERYENFVKSSGDHTEKLLHEKWVLREQASDILIILDKLQDNAFQRGRYRGILDVIDNPEGFGLLTPEHNP